MTYTISEMAEKLGVSTSALRFYENEGLFPNVKRVNGRRIFTDEDFGWLNILHCLKAIGTPIKDIRTYVELAKRGDETLQARYELILNRKQSVLEQIAALQRNLDLIEVKEKFYREKIAEHETENT